MRFQQTLLRQKKQGEQQEQFEHFQRTFQDVYWHVEQTYRDARRCADPHVMSRQRITQRSAIQEKGPWTLDHVYSMLYHMETSELPHLAWPGALPPPPTPPPQPQPLTPTPHTDTETTRPAQDDATSVATRATATHGVRKSFKATTASGNTNTSKSPRSSRRSSRQGSTRSPTARAPSLTASAATGLRAFFARHAFFGGGGGGGTSTRATPVATTTTDAATPQHHEAGATPPSPRHAASSTGSKAGPALHSPGPARLKQPSPSSPNLLTTASGQDHRAHGPMAPTLPKATSLSLQSLAQSSSPVITSPALRAAMVARGSPTHQTPSNSSSGSPVDPDATGPTGPTTRRTAPPASPPPKPTQHHRRTSKSTPTLLPHVSKADREKTPSSDRGPTQPLPNPAPASAARPIPTSRSTDQMDVMGNQDIQEERVAGKKNHRVLRYK